MNHVHFFAIMTSVNSVSSGLVMLLRLKFLTCDPVVAVGHDLDLHGLLPGVSPADAPHVGLHLTLPLPRVLGAHILQLDEALVTLVVALEPEVEGKCKINCSVPWLFD